MFSGIRIRTQTYHFRTMCNFQPFRYTGKTTKKYFQTLGSKFCSYSRHPGLRHQSNPKTSQSMFHGKQCSFLWKLNLVFYELQNQSGFYLSPFKKNQPIFLSFHVVHFHSHSNCWYNLKLLYLDELDDQLGFVLKFPCFFLHYSNNLSVQSLASLYSCMHLKLQCNINAISSYNNF